MALFKLEKELEYIKEKPFKLEREIQNLTEQNLETILGLELVKSEFTLKKFRLDTLAYDREMNAFVIIEYKRDKNFSVIDQGYAYLSSILNNKAELILEFNEKRNEVLKRSTVDWSQSRVLFVSPAFTDYQVEAINFKDIPIELWEVKRFENNTVSYQQIQKSGTQESIKTISKTDKIINSVAKEIKVYSEQEHLENINEEIVDLYKKFKDTILNLYNIELKPTKSYIVFFSGRKVISFCLQKTVLKIWINMRKGELDDPKKITRDVSEIGHWGPGDYEIIIRNDDNLEYILSLVKQSINRDKK